MTEKMSKEIVDVLSKYDTTHVFTLDAFESVFKLTHFNNALLKRASLKSTILACFIAYITHFFVFANGASLLWDSYIPHNATQSLRNYRNIQQYLQKVKGVFSQYVKYLIKSMMGFLYYANNKESNNSEYLLVSKRLIKKSLDLDTSCVKLRAATFFLTNLDYSKSVEMCDTLITFPPTYKMEINYGEHIEDLIKKVSHQLFNGKTSDEIENIMNAILPTFCSSFKLKSLPGNYDMTRQNSVSIFHNFTNIVFHDVSLEVTFMTADKWVVPDPILFELLSLPQVADNEESTFSGIHLDPTFACLQTKFLCYHWMGNVNGMANMLTLMTNFITENTFTTKSSCVYLNMFA
jgi:ABC-type multidrug transport system fused ATPase/permease subunit